MAVTDMLRRYKSWIIGPTFAGLVIATVVAFLWPDTYVSSAVMRITPQQVPERLVPSAITIQMAERLQQSLGSISLAYYGRPTYTIDAMFAGGFQPKDLLQREAGGYPAELHALIEHENGEPP